MTKLYYPNCSELIADFNTKKPREFLRMVSKLGKKYGWHFDPPLEIRILERMVYEERLNKLGADENKTSITVVDKKGNTTQIDYGSNGYDAYLGFRFDSSCNHSDETQFEFFDIAIEECEAEMKCYDGGSLGSFEDWRDEKYEKKKV